MTIEPAEEAFVLPDNLPDAYTALNDLVFNIQSIQGQLGNRNRKTTAGDRMTDLEFWDWRHRAVGALRHREADLRDLKTRIRLLQEGARQKAPKAVGLILVDALVTAYRENRVDDVGRHLVELVETWVVRIIDREEIE